MMLCRSDLLLFCELLLFFVATTDVHVVDAFAPITSRANHHQVFRSPATETEEITTQIPRKPTYKKATIKGPSIDSKPDYSSISGPLGSFVDSILMSLFRYKLAQRLNRPDNAIITPDSKLPLNDFMGIIDLTTRMNSQHFDRATIHAMAQDVLVSLFPKFILDRYPTWFAQPFPDFSARMCAWATCVGGTWLMGECEVNDVPELENGGKSQGVLVTRCRFLEESQCASICVNSCKIPTQNFFYENMGLPLTMTPDYETGECQFAFGKLPTEEENRLAKDTPCLMRCPSNGGMRSWHNGSDQRAAGSNSEKWLEDLKALELEELKNGSGSTCSLMED
eukprot:scaffold2119_cov138-Skeletonema_menzelii.AAC.4